MLDTKTMNRGVDETWVSMYVRNLTKIVKSEGIRLTFPKEVQSGQISEEKNVRGDGVP